MDYTLQDRSIIDMVWGEIEASHHPMVFLDYLKFTRPGAAYREDAIEKLIALDNGEAPGAEVPQQFHDAVVLIEQQAKDGGAIAQFYMGKILHGGLAVEKNATTAEGWYRAAMLQGEPRSFCNLARILRVSPECDINANRAMLHRAVECGEPNALVELGHSHFSHPTSSREELSDKLQAFEYYRQAWEQDVADGGFWMYWMLDGGNGVRQDKVLALKWLQKAAHAGSVQAMRQLARNAQPDDEQVNPKLDLSEPMRWFKQAAQAGDSESQVCLARYLLTAEKPFRDPTRAVHWLLTAAYCNEDALAQHMLGITFIYGRGVIKNEKYGLKWLERAAAGGYAVSQVSLARILKNQNPPDDQAANAWLLRAANSGDADAQSSLGRAALAGTGMAIDHAFAYKWIHLAHLQGHADATFLLGTMHYYGDGVAIDYVKAVTLFRKAAEKGSPNAQGMLGWCLLLGDGTDKDLPSGVLWLSRSIENGDAHACTILGRVFLNGHGVERNYAEAANWFQIAATRGEAAGAYELGLLHASGRGVASDMTEANKWMEEAAKQGNVKAQEWLTDHGPEECLRIC